MKRNHLKTKKKLVNRFDIGGIPNINVQGVLTKPTTLSIPNTPMGNTNSFGNISNAIGAIGGIASNTIGSFSNPTSDQDTYKAYINSIKNQGSGINTTDGLIANYNSWENPEDITYKDILGKGSAGNAAKSALSAAAAGASVGSFLGPIGAGVGAAVGGLASGIGSLFKRRKAKKTARKLNAQMDDAVSQRWDNFQNSAVNVDMKNDLMAQQNFYAEGGGIHIKPANRGKFTEYCGGNVTQECIQRGKHSNSPAVRKRATFADNARKWHHANGGFVNPNIDNYNSDVTIFNNGGTHEQNPNEGIPISLDPQGIPNMVEQGEVKYKDYIFSNRLKPDKEALYLLSISSRHNNTFADIAKKINKESSERPHDPISQNGLRANMEKLQQSQEDFKMRKNKKKSNNNKFADGGFDWQGSLRYAPILGSAIGTALSFKKPDYSSVDKISNLDFSTPDIKAQTIGDYMQYKPIDKGFYTSKLTSANAATQRAIREQSGGNRGAANAAMLANNYNYTTGLGSLSKQLEDQDFSQRQQVAGFNRGTNMFNAESLSKTDAINRQMQAQAKAQRAQALMQAESMRASIDSSIGANRSANFNNLMSQLGDLGKESTDRNMVENLIDAGVFGTMSDEQRSALLGRLRTRKSKRNG